jgi:hypothetical protein
MTNPAITRRLADALKPIADEIVRLDTLGHLIPGHPVSDPIINKRAAEAIKPFVDVALQMQRDGLLENAFMQPGYFLCTAWWELIEAFKNPMAPDP